MSRRNEAQVSEQPIGGINMLKITITETTAERRWIVQGRLVGPWVSELRTTWKKAHRSQDKRVCIIDLNEVTFIDKSGERLLRAMSKKGAQLIASGLYVKHVLEQMKTGRKSALNTLMVCLFAGLQTNVIVPVVHRQAPQAFMETKVKEVKNAIGGANATNPSTDRAETRENQ
jgi:anti-anti-sigma regulatory factor